MNPAIKDILTAEGAETRRGMAPDVDLFVALTRLRVSQAACDSAALSQLSAFEQGHARNAAAFGARLLANLHHLVERAQEAVALFEDDRLKVYADQFEQRGEAAPAEGNDKSEEDKDAETQPINPS